MNMAPRQEKENARRSQGRRKLRIAAPLMDRPDNGPYIFMQRLMHALVARGHHWVGDDADADVRIGVIEEDIDRWHDAGVPVLLRLDGVYHDSAIHFGERNAGMARSHLLADAVVYQSRFARTMARRYLGLPVTPLQQVIPNGAARREKSAPPLFPGRALVFTAARWRPHKRLEDMVQGFLEWRRPDAVLCVAGAVAPFCEHPSVKWLGALSPDALVPYYQQAMAFLHLAWIDWCPNTVVEALAAGTPVICTANGGTRELVGDSGIVLSEAPYDGAPCDLYHPPRVPPGMVADALSRLAAAPLAVCRPDLDIGCTAAAYEAMLLRTVEMRPSLKKRVRTGGRKGENRWAAL